MDLEAALAQVELFSGLDKKHLRKLERLMRTVTYQPGHEIMTAGSAGWHGGLGSMGIVLTGSIGVRHPDGTVFAHIRPGEVFGEMALIDEEPRSATLVAEEQTEVALLAASDFREELKDNQAFALNLIRLLAQRLREARAEQRNT